MKRISKSDKQDRLINELLTQILIGPHDNKLTKSQSQLIDSQFNDALRILNKYGHTISFKFVDMRKINK